MDPVGLLHLINSAVRIKKWGLLAQYSSNTEEEEEATWRAWTHPGKDAKLRPGDVKLPDNLMLPSKVSGPCSTILATTTSSFAGRSKWGFPRSSYAYALRSYHSKMLYWRARWLLTIGTSCDWQFLLVLYLSSWALTICRSCDWQFLTVFYLSSWAEH